MILGQKAQDVLLREALPAPVIEDEQSELAARPCEPKRKSSRFGDVINPQSESVEGLFRLQPERPAEGQGHPDKDLGTGSHLELQRTPPRHQVSHAHAAPQRVNEQIPVRQGTLVRRDALVPAGPGDVDLLILDATDLPRIFSTLVPPIGPSQRSAANLSARACRRPMRWSPRRPCVCPRV